MKKELRERLLLSLFIIAMIAAGLFGMFLGIQSGYARGQEDALRGIYEYELVDEKVLHKIEE